MPLGTGDWNQYLQLSRWICWMDYLQLWKENHVFKLFPWNYSTVCWKECFLCNFKLISRFINRLISAKLRGLNEQSITIDSLSDVLMLSKHSILPAAQGILFGWMFGRCLCIKKPSGNLLKTARAECVWIITPSSNNNRKFLMNKNIYLNVLKAAEIDECQLNSFTSIMRTPTPLSAPVSKGDEPDCLLCWFVPTHNEVHFIRLSRKVNNHTITVLNPYWSVQVAAMYKQKTNKIWSVSSFKSNERAPESDFNWWQWIMNAEKTVDLCQKQGEFDAYLISKFLNIEEFSWLTQEWVDRLIVGDLRSREHELLLWILRNQEKTLAWDYSEISCFHDDVVTSVMIRTVKYEAWQASNFPVLWALLPKIIEMLHEQKRFELLKNCDNPYCNSWFLMKKKITGNYWKVDAATELNKIIKRDTNLPLSVNVFSEKFTEMHYTFLINMFSEYDQILLDPCSCNLTAIQTPIRLLKRTWLLQEVMNSVVQFVWIMLWVLETQTSHICEQFLNDIGVKSSKTDYSGVKILSNVQRFILKHIQNLDRVLCDLKRAGFTVAEVKS